MLEPYRLPRYRITVTLCQDTVLINWRLQANVEASAHLAVLDCGAWRRVAEPAYGVLDGSASLLNLAVLGSRRLRRSPHAATRLDVRRRRSLRAGAVTPHGRDATGGPRSVSVDAGGSVHSWRLSLEGNRRLSSAVDAPLSAISIGPSRPPRPECDVAVDPHHQRQILPRQNDIARHCPPRRLVEGVVCWPSLPIDVEHRPITVIREVDRELVQLPLTIFLDWPYTSPANSYETCLCQRLIFLLPLAVALVSERDP